MRTVSLMILGTMFFSQAQATIIRGWDRPLKGAVMEITEARYGFKKVTSAELTLNVRDMGNEVEPSQSLILAYNVAGVEQLQEVRLIVSKTETDNCGTVHYYANLGRENANGARFSIHLEDHSKRLCDDYRPNMWEAEVRQGFGWCGTMDATMSLVGNPEPIYTIQ